MALKLSRQFLVLVQVVLISSASIAQVESFRICTRAERTWTQYCKLYNASTEEQQQRLGKSVGKLNLRQGHSRLTVFAARHLKDDALAKRAWSEFYGGEAGLKLNKGDLRKITGQKNYQDIAQHL
jgi:hypothetical protein